MRDASVNVFYRYSDIIVHRLLAVAVQADSSYPELLDKKKTQALCYNLNYRHRMAQYAGRASVSLHTQVSAQLYYAPSCQLYVLWPIHN